ncbi:MAG: O-antigen ligase family protein [Verrucomicrobiales bacterium]
MSERGSGAIGKSRIGFVVATSLLACVANEAMATSWARVILFVTMACLIPTIGRRFRHTPRVWAVLCFILAWAGLCFLPGNWFAQPGWLSKIIPSLPDANELTRFVTPQKWVSLQSFLTLAAVLAWGACITGVHWHTEERKLGLSILTGGITVIGIAFLSFKLSNTPWPGAAHDNQFGPFANRNQTATLLALGAVCATGLLLANGRHHWRQTIIWGICLTILTAAVTQAGSRAGVLTMAAGVLAVSGWWSFSSRQWIPLAIGASTLLLACSYLILNGGRLTERIGESISGQTAEGRIDIWLDTGNLIAQAPILGTGLGNFEPAFAQIRDASISEYHVRHPESDWLWAAAEMGLPGVIGIIVLLGMMLARVPWKQQQHVRSRHHLLHITAAIGVVQFVALGCIDVPAHRLGTLLPVVILLAFAIDTRDRHMRIGTASDEPAPTRSSFSIAFRLPQPLTIATLTAIPAVAAISWITLPSLHRAGNLIGNVAQWNSTSDAVDIATTRNTLQQAINMAPLDWRGYFLRATHALSFGPFPREAQRDFQRARMLVPNAPSVPRQEAKAWVDAGLMDYAIPAWREQLRCDPTRIREHFGVMLHTAKDDEDLTRQLVFLAKSYPELQLLALQRAPKGRRFNSLLSETLVAGADVTHWQPRQLASLFKVWLDRGDHQQLKTALTENPRWATIGWKTLFQLHADAGDFSQAAELAEQRLAYEVADARSHVVSLSASDLRGLRLSFNQSRGDLATGLRLARIDAKAGRITDALEVLGHLARIHATSNVPPVLLLKAWCHQQAGQFEEATKAYSDVINHSAARSSEANEWIATIPELPK